MLYIQGSFGSWGPSVKKQPGGVRSTFVKFN